MQPSSLHARVRGDPITVGGYASQRALAWVEMATLGTVRRRVRKSGETYYYLDFRPHGRVWQIPTDVGQVTLTSPDIANRLLEQIRGRVAGGEQLEAVLDSFRRSSRSHVLRRADDWLKAKDAEARAGRKTARSIEEIRSHIRNHWTYWESVSVHEIRTKGQLDDWATHLLERKNLAPSTARNVLALFRSFLRWLEDRGEIRHRLPRFPSVAVPERAPKLLSYEQQDQVLDEIAEDRRGIFLAMADLALRPGEARAMRASDFNRETRTVTVQRAAQDDGSHAKVGSTKTGRVRTLPVTDRLAAWIEAHESRDRIGALLFPGPGGAMQTHTSLQRAWARACLAAGVPSVPLREGTRHSTATAMRRGAIPLDVIQRMLGHSNVQNTERYARWHDAALVQAMTRPVARVSPAKRRVEKDEQ